MGFGEVYTAIQQGVIDGAENNELALTNNKHGEVAKYYSYNKHQMVPDMLVANLKFFGGLSPEEYQVFKDAAALSTEVEMKEWDKSIEEAKRLPQRTWEWNSSMWTWMPSRKKCSRCMRRC